MRPTTVRNRMRGLAIGNPDRFKGSTVYDMVKDLPYTKGPGLILDIAGNLTWLGDAEESYRGFMAELIREAGLAHEEASTLWSFLDWKRHDVWYVKGQKRTEESHKDEEETGKLDVFEFNNLTVRLENGMKLGHFMAIHYGINWFTYKVWPMYSEWKAQTAVSEYSLDIPEFNFRDIPVGGWDRVLWHAELEFMSRFPMILHPELHLEAATSGHDRRYANVKKKIMEDRIATQEIMSEVAKLGKKLLS